MLSEILEFFQPVWAWVLSHYWLSIIGWLAIGALTSVLIRRSIDQAGGHGTDFSHLVLFPRYFFDSDFGDDMVPYTWFWDRGPGWAKIGYLVTLVLGPLRWLLCLLELFWFFLWSVLLVVVCLVLVAVIKSFGLNRSMYHSSPPR
ncbi:MAG: hypothetical protein A2744_03890 [Candidatus Buchananbacteria bacterium RIFCSPHIGHO2_01_FULL_44_11]|uniref:Uncharacterized protein n=1 Tax=Candidatus Buchananbacteria bacterium RIFCSPHIGHO2_01_FULL_44_11 TaxID=1797535 RepID=A0A1G1Y459_9BACT|nr:MAG: hypothetical protein A2744_03890 [Candidatus Buchananbacteria bacterium RIFCSPHIGHO2_01_FULL_44_11]